MAGGASPRAAHALQVMMPGDLVRAGVVEGG
jgi:hypothetical protein